MPAPTPDPNALLLLYTLIAIVGLVILIARFRLNSFIALILASLFVGICSGLKLPDIAKAFQEGVGTTLGFIAIIVGLGTILGKMLAESGGAGIVAEAFVRWFGHSRIQWALVTVAFIVGLPVFFGVGLVLLIPILFTIARNSKTPLLYLGIPVIAGLSVSHGLVPPHPGPLVAIERLGADTGRTILYSLIIGFPTAIVAGPVFARFIAHRVHVQIGGLGEQLLQTSPRQSSPGVALTLFTILLPVILMMFATLATVTLDQSNPLRPWAEFLGSPLVAMLLAVLWSLYAFGVARGFSSQQILKFTEECVGPAAGIFLVVGAGGGFSKVLDYSGVDDAVVSLVAGFNLSPLLLGWLVAALIRVAVGSATVSITMAAALIGPIAASLPDVNRELLVIAMGAGSLILSHLNDGGFWFVKEYFNLTVPQTLKTWTVMETIISVVALVGVLLLNEIV